MYQPTKEHLDTQIPDAFRGINEILRELKKETGADDRYVSLMLETSGGNLRLLELRDLASINQYSPAHIIVVTASSPP